MEDWKVTFSLFLPFFLLNRLFYSLLFQLHLSINGIKSHSVKHKPRLGWDTNFNEGASMQREKMGCHKMWQPIFSLYIRCDQIVPVTVKVPVPGVTIQLPVAGSCV